MPESHELRALTQAESDAIGPNNIKGFGGPWKARADRPDLLGDVDYLCPSCKEVVVEKTNAEGIKGLYKIQCWNCGVESSGTGLIS
jgi:hypothetical protein